MTCYRVAGRYITTKSMRTPQIDCYLSIYKALLHDFTSQEKRKKEKENRKVAYWNSCNTQDSEDRPQRRSALVARETAWPDIDIAALSEVLFAEQGSITEDIYGVGFMIKTSIARKLQNCQWVIQTASCP